MTENWWYIPSVSWIDLHSLNEESLSWCDLVSPRGPTYGFPWCLNVFWCWYFHLIIYIFLFYAFTYNLLSIFCMIGIRGDDEGEGAWWQREVREAFQIFFKIMKFHVDQNIHLHLIMHLLLHVILRSWDFHVIFYYWERMVPWKRKAIFWEGRVMMFLYERGVP